MFGAVLGASFRFLGATGALLTPRRGPGTEKVVRGRKNQFLGPRARSGPNGTAIRSSFPYGLRMGWSGDAGKRISIKNVKIVLRGNFHKAFSGIQLSVASAASFEKHNENTCFL